MIKFVLLIKCGSGCICNVAVAAYAMWQWLHMQCGSGCICNLKVLFWCVSCASRKFLIRKMFQDNQSGTVSFPTSPAPKRWSHTSDRQKFLKTAVIYCAALQIGRSPVRSQLVSLEFFIEIILPIALWPWGRLGL